MVVYYTSKDLQAIKSLHYIKAAISTSRITRYLLTNKKMLERKRNVVGDSIILNLEFYFPIRNGEFIIGGVAYHSTKSLGPIWFERHVINHFGSSCYQYKFENPILLELLQDKTNVGFFAFPYQSRSKEELMFSLELSPQLF